MLNLNCVICAEIFVASDDVHCTSCGHMFHISCLSQWLQRSKTCPQCRNKCTDRNIIRVYFNLANLDVSRIDVGSLQEQLDNVQLQLKVKEREIRQNDESIKKFKETQKKCMKTISGLENDLKSKNFLILNYVEKVKMLESQNKVMESLRQECRDLKEQIQTMEGINTLLTSTMADAEKLLNNERDPKVLAVWITTLKRELRVCENKKADIRNVLKVVQNDLRKEIEHKKELNETISNLESKNYQLAEKIRDLETMRENNNSSTMKSHNNSTIGLNTPIMSPYLTNIKDDKRLTISPTIKDNIKKIEESSSPYLNIKSCGVLLPPSLMRNHENRTNSDNKYTTAKLKTLKVSPTKKPSARPGALRKTSSDLSDTYTIFKKPRLGFAAGTTSTSKPLASNFAFDGFGGSERVNPFDHKSESDDEVEMVEQTTSNDQNKEITKPKVSTTSNLNNRFKTGGLRNFKITK